MKSFKRYPADYRRKTHRLTLAEHGAYALLLDEYYATERPLPAETARICRIAGAHSSDEQAAVMTVLNEYWHLTPDGWVNPRAREEIEKAPARDKTACTEARTDCDTDAEPVPDMFEELLPRKALPVKVVKPRKPASKSGPVWDAYKASFKARYGVEPVQNARVSVALSQLVDRLGPEDAVAVAGWYPSHNDRWYILKGHSVAVMVADAEKLRTEWATGQTVTSTKAAQLDRGQSNFDAAAEAERIREARE